MLTVFFKTACLFLICAAGFILRRRGIIDTNFNRQLSLVQINAIYPALILSSLTRNYTWTKLLDDWTLPAGSALIMLTGWVIGGLCLPLLRRQSRPTAAMFHFQCAINNYSFLPIMLATTMLGETGVAQIIFSAIGAEVVVWTLGVQALARGNREPGTPTLQTALPCNRPTWQGWFYRLRDALRPLCSMPLLAMGLGAAWLLLRHLAGDAIDAFQATAVGGDFSDMLSMALDMTGKATIPVAAIIVGSRIAEIPFKEIFAPLVTFLSVLRLVVIPALATVLILWLPFPAAVRPALLIVAVQPCAMASVMFGEAYGCDARLAASTVLATHLLSLATMPLWLSAPWMG